MVDFNPRKTCALYPSSNAFLFGTVISYGKDIGDDNCFSFGNFGK